MKLIIILVILFSQLLSASALISYNKDKKRGITQNYKLRGTNILKTIPLIALSFITASSMVPLMEKEPVKIVHLFIGVGASLIFIIPAIIIVYFDSIKINKFIDMQEYINYIKTKYINFAFVSRTIVCLPFLFCFEIIALMFFKEYFWHILILHIYTFVLDFTVLLKDGIVAGNRYVMRLFLYSIIMFLFLFFLINACDWYDKDNFVHFINLSSGAASYIIGNIILMCVLSQNKLKTR